MIMKPIKVKNIEIGGDKPVLIAGPCAIESREMVLRVAETLGKITSKLEIPFVFKASYDKANRLSVESERGMGFPRGLAVLAEIATEFDFPIITDVHETYQVEAVSSVADILQIPAFLCRQTDLVLAAAKTGKPINIKKGQFIAPENMKFIAGKALSVGNERIMLTERGSSFGYNDLIFDPRSIVTMKEFGFPIIVDVTHTCQKPGASGGKSGGDRKFAIPFGKVALALDADGIYMEVHPDPANAISDSEIQIPLDSAEKFIEQIFLSRSNNSNIK